MSATGDRVSPPQPAYTWQGEGFTLIETLAIIGVLALISALAFPRIEQMLGGVEFASARMMVAGAAADARGTAIRRDSPVTLTVSADGANILIDDATVAHLPSGVHITSVPRAITYYSDGTATGGNLALVNDRRRGALAIASETGLSRWMP